MDRQNLTLLTDLYELGINAEHVFFTINGNPYILADFFGNVRRQLSTHIELTTTYQVWQIILAFIVQAMKNEVFAVESKSLGGYAESDDFEVGELGDNATSWDVFKFINTIFGEILADSEDFGEICYKYTHKQCDST